MISHNARCVVLVLVVIGCTALPRSANAQVAAAPGDRVRIVDAANSLLITGDLVRLSGDSVSISTVTTGTGAVTHGVWSLQGRRHLEVRRWRGHAFAGALIGQVGGMLAAYAVAPKDNTAIAAGIVVGTVIGAVIGHRVKTESWRRVDYCLECVTIAPITHGMSLAVSLSF
jgi:hypothetical protein